MPPQTRLKPSQRIQVLGMRDANIPTKQISDLAGIPASTVRYTKRKAPERGSDQEDLPRAGRPRRTSKQQNIRLYRHVKRRNTMSWDEIEKLTPLKRSSIRQKLREIDPDLRRRRSLWRPLLSKDDALIRLRHAERYGCWRAEDFHKVWYTDECTVEIGKGECDLWRWMHSGEQYLPENCMKRSRNHETVMVWAAMRWDGTVVWCFVDEYYGGGRTNTAEAYSRLLTDVLPEIYAPGDIFMHDNSPIHTAHKIRALLEDLGITIMPHPPYSPDLNPIEHLWAALKALVTRLHPELKDMPGGKEKHKMALKAALRHAFEVLQADNIEGLTAQLVESMPRRLQAVRKARGYQTTY